jgi:hypothetical protein
MKESIKTKAKKPKKYTVDIQVSKYVVVYATSKAGTAAGEMPQNTNRK